MSKTQPWEVSDEFWKRVEARCAPLSLIVTGANRHDVTQLGKVLAMQKTWMPPPLVRRSKRLYADASYQGAPAKALMD